MVPWHIKFPAVEISNTIIGIVAYFDINSYFKKTGRYKLMLVC